MMKFLLTPFFNVNSFMLKGQRLQGMLPCDIESLAIRPLESKRRK
jgi:hypothetical protein